MTTSARGQKLGTLTASLALAMMSVLAASCSNDDNNGSGNGSSSGSGSSSSSSSGSGSSSSSSSGSSGTSSSSGASGSSSGGTVATAKTPIQHVILIIGENRTYDHVFGTYTPVSGQSASNLLSKGILKADGTPGPNVSLAAQYQATARPRARLTPRCRR